MEAPDKIYVSRPIYNQCGLVISEDKPVEYIRKDLLLEWAKERYQSTISNVGCYTGHSVWQEVIDKLNNF